MRIGGRRTDELRKIKIERNYNLYAEGSVLIEMGNTKVICTATIEDRLPPFRKLEGLGGWITAEYGMLPRANATRNLREAVKGKMTGRTHEIQRLIGRSLRAVVDLSQLGERTVILDCDVIQADGGTRTASITGAFIALTDALKGLVDKGELPKIPLKDSVAAISVGKVKGELLLDLCYEEDSSAEVDMNIIMTGSGKFVEIQGTGEEATFDQDELMGLLGLAKKGLLELKDCQRSILGEVLK